MWDFKTFKYLYLYSKKGGKREEKGFSSKSQPSNELVPIMTCMAEAKSSLRDHKRGLRRFKRKKHNRFTGNSGTIVHRSK